MLLAETLAILMVVAVVAALMAGYPVALTLAGVSLIFAIAGQMLGVMSFAILGALPQRIFGVMTNEVLLAIPLFIFMGVMLERSRIAEDLLETMGRLFGTLRGGLGISAVIVGTLLAAAKGVVGATTVTMGLIMLPAMLRFGYDPRLAAGTVAATATLAQRRSWCCSATSLETRTRPRSSRRAFSRHARSRSATCSRAHWCQALRSSHFIFYF
jgi:TRAP-type mannitol/chloroaromatic compound transport system permease large subunit